MNQSSGGAHYELLLLSNTAGVFRECFALVAYLWLVKQSVVCSLHYGVIDPIGTVEWSPFTRWSAATFVVRSSPC